MINDYICEVSETPFFSHFNRLRTNVLDTKPCKLYKMLKKQKLYCRNTKKGITVE